MNDEGQQMLLAFLHTSEFLRVHPVGSETSGLGLPKAAKAALVLIDFNHHRGLSLPEQAHCKVQTLRSAAGEVQQTLDAPQTFPRM